MNDLAGKHLLLGLSGGIACYKSAELTRLLIQAGATVQVVMTDAAQRFITPVTMLALSGRPAYTSQWYPRIASHMAHIDLARVADTSLINMAQLRAEGVTVLGAASGPQACGETGEGRLLEPGALCNAVAAFFQPKVLQDKRVLLTAGPTFEPLDPIRGITNRSSGKMGFALARAAAEAGAQVQLIAGPVALPTPDGVSRIDVQTGQQMYEAVMACINACDIACDIFIAVAAVSDWRAEPVSAEKIKKNGERGAPRFAFTENPDILAAVTRLPKPPFCVGFAAECNDLETRGREKRLLKNVPLLVGNIGPDTFGKDENELTLFDASGVKHLPRADKLTLARTLVEEISKRL